MQFKLINLDAYNPFTFINLKIELREEHVQLKKRNR